MIYLWFKIKKKKKLLYPLILTDLVSYSKFRSVLTDLFNVTGIKIGFKVGLPSSQPIQKKMVILSFVNFVLAQ